MERQHLWTRAKKESSSGLYWNSLRNYTKLIYCSTYWCVRFVFVLALFSRWHASGVLQKWKADKMDRLPAPK